MLNEDPLPPSVSTRNAHLVAPEEALVIRVQVLEGRPVGVLCPTPEGGRGIRQSPPSSFENAASFHINQSSDSWIIEGRHRTFSVWKNFKNHSFGLDQF